MSYLSLPVECMALHSSLPLPAPCLFLLQFYISGNLDVLHCSTEPYDLRENILLGIKCDFSQ